MPFALFGRSGRHGDDGRGRRARAARGRARVPEAEPPPPASPAFFLRGLPTYPPANARPFGGSLLALWICGQTRLLRGSRPFPLSLLCGRIPPAFPRQENEYATPNSPQAHLVQYPLPPMGDGRGRAVNRGQLPADRARENTQPRSVLTAEPCPLPSVSCLVRRC